MEDRNHETRHIFMAIGICIFFFSPILLSFVPQSVANSLHHTEGVWYVFAPKENFMMYGVGFFILFISSILLFFIDIKKLSVLIGTLLVFASLCCFLIASQSYKSLGKEMLSFSPLFSIEDYSYQWNEVDKIIMTMSEKRGLLQYKFLFTDGNSMTFENDAYFRAIRKRIDFKIKELDLVTERVETP